MSSAKDTAKRAIEKIRNAKPGVGQSTALSTLMSDVRDFVDVVRAEAELAKELPELQRELTEKQGLLNQPDIDHNEERDLQTQIADLSGTIQEADAARRTVATNRATLKSLQKEVEQLRAAINSAL